MILPRSTPVHVTPERLDELMLVAHQAASAASAVTCHYFRQPMVVENKAAGHHFDPVTQADREAEQAIRQVLYEHAPEIGFLGEEYAARQGHDALLWVVDPIDGTRAFMSGMPLWGTLIGLYDGQESILGVIDQPFLQERYCAVNGQAWLEGTSVRSPLKTRQNVDLDAAVAYCTTPDMFTDSSAFQSFTRLRQSVQLMRYGGDCYAYALLAAGYVDIVIDCDLQPYDIMAPIAVVESAGGVISNWQGESAVDGGYVVAAASQTLHQKTLAVLQSEPVLTC